MVLERSWNKARLYTLILLVPKKVEDVLVETANEEQNLAELDYSLLAPKDSVRLLGFLARSWYIDYRQRLLLWPRVNVHRWVQTKEDYIWVAFGIVERVLDLRDSPSLCSDDGLCDWSRLKVYNRMESQYSHRNASLVKLPHHALLCNQIHDSCL
jgi:hypothetical protein